MSDAGHVAAGNGRPPRPPGAAVGKGRRQRRPTGAPPPLPHPVTMTTTAWLVLAALVLAGAFVASQHTPWLRMDDRASTWMLRQLAGMRTPWLTDVANGINAAGSGWGATVLGLSVVILTLAFRRWRHLVVFMGSLLFLEFAGGSALSFQPRSVLVEFTPVQQVAPPGRAGREVKRSDEQPDTPVMQDPSGRGGYRSSSRVAHRKARP